MTAQSTIDNRRWRAKNPERSRVYQQAWAVAHREAKRIAWRKWYYSHREQAIARVIAARKQSAVP
jgi:hypothetical protein